MIDRMLITYEAEIKQVLALADAVADLRSHLEGKQQMLMEDNIADLSAYLSSETLILKRIKRLQKELDANLSAYGQLSSEGGYSVWLEEIYPLCDHETQKKMTAMAEDTIACREMQFSQDAALTHALAYYQSMVRFLSGVQDWTYTPNRMQ